MRQATYEIHLRGPLPPGLLASLAGGTSTEIGGETVLLTPPIDQTTLHQLIARLRDLGIELVDLRQAAAPATSGRSAVRAPLPDDGRTGYELRLRGLLGPLLLGRLPHAAVSFEPRHTLLVTSAADGGDLVDVLQALVDTGVQVDLVRELSPAEDDDAALQPLAHQGTAEPA